MNMKERKDGRWKWKERKHETKKAEKKGGVK